MYSIAMIAFQFGKLPNYFQLWLNSAAFNESVDFFIYTDDHAEYDMPKNVHIIEMSFQEMKDKIQSKFDFEVCIDKPYKVCDYRPAFGYIFEEDFKKYDFWGTVDLDVILGDIRSFVTDEVLNNYNRFLTRDHFTLYRNREDINRRFMKKMNSIEKPYKQVFTNASIYAFGERAPISVWNIWLDNGWYNEEYDQPIDGNINYNVYRLKTFYDNDGKGSVFVYNRGKLIEYTLNNSEKIVTKEWLYIHLGRRNMKSYVNEMSCQFIVTPDKFISYREIDASIVKKYSGCLMWIFDKLRLVNRTYIMIQRRVRQLWVK